MFFLSRYIDVGLFQTVDRKKHRQHRHSKGRPLGILQADLLTLHAPHPACDFDSTHQVEPLRGHGRVGKCGDADACTLALWRVGLAKEGPIGSGKVGRPSKPITFQRPQGRRLCQ